MDWTDRTTCILFGDAAGAVLVQVVGFMQAWMFSVLFVHADIGSICSCCRY